MSLARSVSFCFMHIQCIVSLCSAVLSSISFVEFSHTSCCLPLCHFLASLLPRSCRPDHRHAAFSRVLCSFLLFPPKTNTDLDAAFFGSTFSSLSSHTFSPTPQILLCSLFHYILALAILNLTICVFLCFPVSPALFPLPKHRFRCCIFRLYLPPPFLH